MEKREVESDGTKPDSGRLTERVDIWTGPDEVGWRRALGGKSVAWIVASALALMLQLTADWKVEDPELGTPPDIDFKG